MPKIRLVLEYNGAGFHGWQEQPGLRTIQEEVHKALEVILREKIPSVMSAGRTDAGVHARGQVVHFICSEVPDLTRLQHGVSSILRNEVSVVDAAVVSDSFHARESSVAKQYSYRIIARRWPPTIDRGLVWHVGAPLNEEVMRREASTIIGQHDFTSFRGTGCTAKSPIKTLLESEIYRDGDIIVYRVVAKGFMKQMVRNIVGTLVQIGKGHFWTESMLEVLKCKDRVRAGMTAPAYGLCLDWVRYE